MTIGEAEILAAAQWWSTALVRPKYDALGTQRDEPMEFAQFLLGAIHKPLSAEQLAVFRESLANELRKEASGQTHFYLGVDYQPCLTLDTAARKAGIDTNDPATFPIKTSMWMEPNEVKVRHGYGAEIVRVFPKPEGVSNG